MSRWNGEFYGNFGPSADRRWHEALKYGFFSAGGNRARTKQLDQLSVGSRIWVYVPRKGYVNVGEIQGEPTLIDDFYVDIGDARVPITQTKTRAAGLRSRSIAEQQSLPIDTCEYFVSVKWLKRHFINDAVKRDWFYHDRSLVSRPGYRSPGSAEKWAKTLAYLKKRWKVT